MDYMDYYEKTVDSQCLHQGKITDYVIKKVELPNGKVATREIVLHDAACGILALDDQGRALFVKQFRKAIDRSIYEIPAGLIDPGEKAIEAAQRELLEETAYGAGHWEKIAEFYTSAGFSNEYMTIFEARNLKKVAENLQLDEDEFLQVERFSLDQALEKYKEGLMPDAKTVVALMHWQSLER